MSALEFIKASDFCKLDFNDAHLKTDHAKDNLRMAWEHLSKAWVHLDNLHKSEQTRPIANSVRELKSKVFYLHSGK